MLCYDHRINKVHIINRTRSDAYEDSTFLYLILFCFLFFPLRLLTMIEKSKEDVGLMTNDLLTESINSESCNNVDEEFFFY